MPQEPQNILNYGSKLNYANFIRAKSWKHTMKKIETCTETNLKSQMKVMCDVIFSLRFIK